MSTARELAAALESRPDDPNVWLVYADFLAGRECPLEGLCRKEADRLRVLVEYPAKSAFSDKERRALKRNRATRSDELGRVRPKAIRNDVDPQSDPGYRWLLWQLSKYSTRSNVHDRMEQLAELSSSTGDHRQVMACVAEVLRIRGERVGVDEWYWRLVELCQRLADDDRPNDGEVDAVDTMLGEAIEADDAEREIRQQREPSRRYGISFDHDPQPFTEGTEILLAIRSSDPSRSLLNTGFDLLGTSEWYEEAFEKLGVRNPFPVPGDR